MVSGSIRDLPSWNPFPSIPPVNEYDLAELHSDPKVSVGAGVRLLVEGLVIRVDAAGSDEGGEVQMFFGQTF